MLKSAGVCTEAEEGPAKVRQQESMSEDGVKEGAQQGSSEQEGGGGRAEPSSPSRQTKLTEGYAGVGNIEPDTSPTTLAKVTFSAVACGVSALDNANRHQNDCVVGNYRTVMVRVVFIGAPETGRPIQP